MAILGVGVLGPSSVMLLVLELGVVVNSGTGGLGIAGFLNEGGGGGGIALRSSEEGWVTGGASWVIRGISSVCVIVGIPFAGSISLSVIVGMPFPDCFSLWRGFSVPFSPVCLS